MNGTKAKLRKLERYEIAMEQFQRWLVEFPDLLHALRTLQAHVDGESLNAGTSLGLEHCSINGLREQLRRSKRQADADARGSAKAGEVDVPASLQALSASATPGKWRSMREGNQFVDTSYLPTAKCVGASRIDGPKRPWNPHALITFGFKPEEYEKVRMTDADADFVCALVNWCRETIALSTQRGGASEMGVGNG
jgi:hypothetical protein